MQKSAATGVIALLAILVLAWQSVFVVNEWDQVILTQFGEPVEGGPITEAGIHFRTPFVQEVNRFDKRVQEWDGERNEFPTADKRFIWVDTTARWRIADPLLFLTSVRDTRSAQMRLDDVLDAAARDQISAFNLVESVRVSNRILDEVTVEDDESVLMSADAERVEVGREEIANRIKARAETTVLKQFGIELVDVQIKRINYVKSVREKVYARMRSERERIAERFRSEGQGLQAKISGQMVREQKQIESEAYRKSQETIARADAEAARIFNEAYAKDPEFYAFWRSLAAYEKVVGDNHTLVIAPDAPLYRYLFAPALGDER